VGREKKNGPRIADRLRVNAEIVLFSGQRQGLGAIPELNFTPHFRIVGSGLRHNRVIQGRFRQILRLPLRGGDSLAMPHDVDR